MKLYKIKKSKIDNKRGLYATKDIKEGTKIINYIRKSLQIEKLKSQQNLTIINQSIYSHLIIDIPWTETFIGILQV